MNDEYEAQVHTTWLPSDTNTVFIKIETKYEEILRDPTTGHQTLTGRSVPVSPSPRISFSLLSSDPQHIRSVVSTQLDNFPNWLYDLLASGISTYATNLGFGCNGFNLTMTVTVTYQTLVLPGPSSSNHEGSLRDKMLKMVLLGEMKEKESKSLKMKTESCSICLENFSSSNSKPTRMTCSHVFHAPCLVEWLYRKNSCPLCRNVLYDR